MREAKKEGEVAFYSCAGTTNPADVFTKWVGPAIFLAAMLFINGMGIVYGSASPSE